MDYQHIIEDIYTKIQPLASQGKQADYIPALASVDPNQFGMAIRTLDGELYQVGNADVRFTLQSISKVFSLAMAMSILDQELWQRMGKEPSGTAFNSLIQLEIERGKPRNPFINAGAIVLADVLMEHLDYPKQQFLNFVRQLSASNEVCLNHEVAVSEESTGYLNAAIANLLKHHGNIRGDIKEVLNLYFTMCSVEMNCLELAQAFIPWANNSHPFEYTDVHLTSSQVKRMNAIMQTCGFYDEAGEFSYLVGLPGKSGVGGGIAAVYPGRYSVAVWSPRLNAKGNSVMGMKALELLTTYTRESIF